jgi:hypothetical protein
MGTAEEQEQREMTHQVYRVFANGDYTGLADSDHLNAFPTSADAESALRDLQEIFLQSDGTIPELEVRLVEVTDDEYAFIENAS